MNPPGKTVLIVDDDKALLQACAGSLKAYAADLDILTAGNGLRAIDILGAGRVDLVVTGLKMPGMDGFQLLLHMKKHFPAIPVIVMTTACSPEEADRLRSLGAVSYLEKPVNTKDLALKTFREIASASQGNISGVTLAGFLQLIVMEEKTCAVKVKSGEKSGVLLIKDGDLIDARTEDLGGEAAACDIVTWEDAEIKMGNYTGDRRKNVDATLGDLLVDAFRMKVERETAARDREKPAGPRPAGDAGPGETKEVDATGGSGPAKAAGAGREPAAPAAAAGGKPAAPAAAGDNPAASAPAADRTDNVVRFNKEKPMATLRDLLSELSKLQGVHAVCLVGCDGFLIDSISNAKMEAELVGAIASSGFGASESIGRELGRGTLEITMLEFEQGPVIVSPVGKDFLLVIVAGKDASLGMLRLKMKKLGTAIEAAAEAV